jgi:hypothetical protein
MVYEECLVVGKIFYTHNRDDRYIGDRYVNYKLFGKPLLALIRVCKQIHAEAEPIYLSKNLFVLPAYFAKHESIVELRDIASEVGAYEAGAHEGLTNTRSLFSKAGISYIRNISIPVDQIFTVKSGRSYDEWMNDKDEGSAAWWGELSPYDRYLQRHKSELDYVKGCWRGDLKYLELFTSGFRFLELDLSAVCCPKGCCRHIDHVVGPWIAHIKPQEFHVIGLCYEQEERDFRSEAHYCGVDGQKLKEYGLHFRSRYEGTQWDRWMLKNESEDENEYWAP